MVRQKGVHVRDRVCRGAIHHARFLPLIKGHSLFLPLLGGGGRGSRSCIVIDPNLILP
jgi:hypothetical protein